MAIYLPKLI